ncbi:MAG: hypothetical protein AAFX93_12870 [Verrucomicrobiota bacterium]
MPQDTQKHKTVGVSFHPDLRSRASERARGIGLSFSRYVTLCVEAELNGQKSELLSDGIATPTVPTPQVQDVNLQSAINAGGQYSAAKAASIDFEDDIEQILEEEGLAFTRYSTVANLRTDFLVKYTDPESGREVQIALECKHKLQGRYNVTLGQLIILRSLPMIDAVILCVPYMRNFDENIRETFAQQEIPIAIPDTVGDTIRRFAREGK